MKSFVYDRSTHDSEDNRVTLCYPLLDSYFDVSATAMERMFNARR